MEVLSAKIVAMVLLGALALFFGLLPLKIKPMILKGEENSRKRTRRERIISGLLCFGAGVLLATVFIHMLPETREGFERLRKSKVSESSQQIALRSHDHHDHTHHHSENESEWKHADGHVHHNNESDNDYHDHDHNHDSDHMHHDNHNISHESTESNTINTTQDQNSNQLGHIQVNGHDHSHDHDHSYDHDHLHPNDHNHHEHEHLHPNDHGHENDNPLHPPDSDHAAHNENNNSALENTNKLNNETINSETDHQIGSTNEEIYSKPQYTGNAHRHQRNDTRHQAMKTLNEDFTEAISSSNKTENDMSRTHRQKTPTTIKPQSAIDKHLELHDHGDHEHGSHDAHEHDGHHTHDLHEQGDHDHTDHHNHNPSDHHEVDVHHHHDDHHHDAGHEHDAHNHENINHADYVPGHNENATILAEFSGTDETTQGSGFRKDQNSNYKQNDNNFPSDINEEENVIHNKHYGIELLSQLHKADPAYEALHQPHNHSNETEESHEHAHEHEDDHGYPLAELVICIGFLLIYLLEEIIHKTLLKHSEDNNESNGLLTRTLSGRVLSSRNKREGHAAHSHFPQNSSQEDRHSASRKKVSSNGHVVNCTNYEESQTKDSRWGMQGIDNPVFAGDIEATSWNPALRNSIISEVNNQVSPASPPQLNGHINYGTSLNGPLSESAPKAKDKGKTLAPSGICGHILANARSLLVVIALSFHSIFEGMAAGLQEVQQDVWYIFLAISAHKFVIIFCIGLELLVDGTPLALYLLYILGLSLVTPIGMGIGIIVTEYQSFGGIGHNYIIIILQGIAGGTLLYVALLEVLERERSKPGGRLMKLICLTLGFALMASLEAVGGHSHEPANKAH